MASKPRPPQIAILESCGAARRRPSSRCFRSAAPHVRFSTFLPLPSAASDIVGHTMRADRLTPRPPSTRPIMTGTCLWRSSSRWPTARAAASDADFAALLADASPP